MAEIAQRGIDRGEFRPVKADDVVHALIAPLLFLVMNKHSLGACVPAVKLDARAVIEAQIARVLHGLASLAPAPSSSEKAAAVPKRQ